MSSDSESSYERQLLTSKVIHALPVVRTLWWYGLSLYDNAKNSTPLVQRGFEALEARVEPLVSKYKSVDNFANSQVDKLKSLYDVGASVVPSPSGMLQAAAYPVGYAYGLALGSLNALESSVQDTRFEGVVERLYDVADSVIDGILPAQTPEATDDSEHVLRRKNPMRRVGRRASLQAVRALPKNVSRYALYITKKCTQDVATSSLDYAIVLMWKWSSSSFSNAERIFRVLMKFGLTRGLLERPIPWFYDFTESYGLTKRLRHEGSLFLNSSMNTLLSQLDTLYSFSGSKLPRTAELIEMLSLNIYNLQQLLESTSRKRHLLYEEDGHSLKRKKQDSSAGKREESDVRVRILSRPHRHSAKPTKSMNAVAPSAVEENPFSVLYGKPEPKVKAHHANSKHLNKPLELLNEEPTEGDAQVSEEAHAQQLKDRAKHEMERWRRQEEEARLAKERHDRDAKLREQQLLKERAKETEKVEREQRLRKELKAREKERARLERQEKEAQEQRDEEIFQKELAHAKAAQEHRRQKEARDEELRISKKRAEVEKAVRKALAEREEHEREENKEELQRQAIARELIAQEEQERAEAEAEAEAVAEKEEAKKPVKATKSHTKHQAEKKEPEEIKPDDREVVLIGNTKVVDEHTNWTVPTEDEQPWETVTKKHATRLQASEVLSSPPLEDADHTPVDAEHNPYFIPEKRQDQVTPPATGSASV